MTAFVAIVIRSNGDLGGYLWKLDHKLTVLGWGASQLNHTLIEASL